MKKQVSNKKFKITIASLCLGFVAVIGALVGVWAASMQTYEAGFKVVYDVDENVAAGVRAEYRDPADGLVKTAVLNKSGSEIEHTDGYVIFDANEGNESAKSVYFGDFSLTPQAPSVEFYFTIQNRLNKAEGYLNVDLRPSFTISDNVNVEYSYCNPDTFVSTASASSVSDSAYTNEIYENIAYQEFKLIKIVISVDDVNNNAECEGTFEMSLNYTTEAETVQEVATADDFVSAIATAADSGKYTYVTLADDIDVADLITSASAVSTTASVTDLGCLFDSFYGEIDAGGHRIYMESIAVNNADLVNDNTEYPAIFREFSGVLKNAILDFGEMEGQIAWCSVSKANLPLTFENVSTEGVATLPNVNGLAKNYSPFLYKGQGDISFINCTNNLDIIAVAPNARIAAFIGGYVNAGGNTDTFIDANFDGVWDSDTQNPKKGMLRKEVNLTFINCVNTGYLKASSEASMLYGNYRAVHPQRKDIVVKNCVNEGQIIGGIAAGLFMPSDITIFNLGANYYRHIPAYVDSIENPNFGYIVNGPSGECYVPASLTGMSVSMRNGSQIVITNTTGNAYSYQIGFAPRFNFVKEDGSTFDQTIAIGFDISSTNSTPVNTGIYRYAFLTTTGYKALTSKTETKVENATVITGLGELTAELYIVTSGTNNYYYLKLSDATISYNAGDASAHTKAQYVLNITALDSQGELASSYSSSGYDAEAK